MPIMPFHLEKGQAMLALDDLFNNPQRSSLLAEVHAGLSNGTPMGEVLVTALEDAPVLSTFANANAAVTGAGGLGPFVSGAWFDQQNQPPGHPPGQTWKPPPSYWIDYDGQVDEIVRKAMLFAIEVAWGIAPKQHPFTKPASPRRIEFWWHCAQRWFDSWVTWESATDAVRVFFATPVHTYGTVHSSVVTAETTPANSSKTRMQATRIAPGATDPNADVVLITHERHQRRFVWNAVTSSAAYPGIALGPPGAFPIPAVGLRYQGDGDVDAWRIDVNAGGVQPLANTGWR